MASLYEAKLDHATYYGSLLKSLGIISEKNFEVLSNQLDAVDLEWTNIQLAQEWIVENATIDRQVALLCSDFAIYASEALSLRYPNERIRWLKDGFAGMSLFPDDFPRRISLRLNLAKAYNDEGKYEQAKHLCDLTLNDAERIQDKEAKIAALDNIGIALKGKGRVKQSISYHWRAVALAREIRDQNAECEVLGHLADAYSQYSESQSEDRRDLFQYKATRACEKALEIARKIGSQRKEGVLLVTMAKLFASHTEFQRAIEHYFEASSLFNRSGDLRNEGDVLVGLGQAYDQLKEPHKAIEYYEAASIPYKKINDLDRIANALSYTSLAFDSIGNRLQAKLYAVRAINIFLEKGQIPNPWLSDQLRRPGRKSIFLFGQVRKDLFWRACKPVVKPIVGILLRFFIFLYFLFREIILPLVPLFQAFFGAFIFILRFIFFLPLYDQDATALRYLLVFTFIVGIILFGVALFSIP